MEPQKLRLLGLHGYNNTGEFMKYQFRHMMPHLSDMITVDFIDGTFDCDSPPD